MELLIKNGCASAAKYMQLLELMDSKLMLDSEYGRGSAFFFGLQQKIVDDTPIGDYKAVYERALKDTAHYQESFQAPDAKILIVDDTRMNLEVGKGLLKKTRIQTIRRTVAWNA